MHLAVDGQSALEALRTEAFDIVVLDWMLPDIDGLQVLRTLRAEGRRLPVLFLTARGEVDDRVDGLDAGADDYMTKPFALAELCARVRTLLATRLRPPANAFSKSENSASTSWATGSEVDGTSSTSPPANTASSPFSPSARAMLSAAPPLPVKFGRRKTASPPSTTSSDVTHGQSPQKAPRRLRP